MSHWINRKIATICPSVISNSRREMVIFIEYRRNNAGRYVYRD
ncbi:MAG: hypothetical protein ACTS77_03455 [Arsenophonus sp. NC-TX2-MAG3]